MKILVFSDSHGKSGKMKEIISAAAADIIIHLGDGCREIEQLEQSVISDAKFLYVKGNCDSFSCDIPKEIFIELEGYRFLILHGHCVNVKSGTETLEKYARAKGADIALFGHTHCGADIYLPGCDGERPLRLFNPGSIAYPARGAASFGYIEIKNGQIITNCAEY